MEMSISDEVEQSLAEQSVREWEIPNSNLNVDHTWRKRVQRRRQPIERDMAVYIPVQNDAGQVMGEQQVVQMPVVEKKVVAQGSMIEPADNVNVRKELKMSSAAF